jgi:hypothetical protein
MEDEVEGGIFDNKLHGWRREGGGVLKYVVGVNCAKMSFFDNKIFKYVGSLNK